MTFAREKSFEPKYAIVDGKIATIRNGVRIVLKYKSGEPLQGKIQN